MSFNLSPKNIYRGTNSDGSKFKIEEYDFQTDANIQIGNFLMYLIFGAFFGLIVSLIFFIIGVLAFNGKSNMFFILSMIFSSYFLFDAYQGWIMLRIINIFISDEVLNVWVSINIALLVTSLIIVLFNKKIHTIILENSPNVISCWVLFILLILFTFQIPYRISRPIIEKNKGWQSKNLKLGEKKFHD